MRIVCFSLLALGCAGLANAATFFNSSGPSANAATRADWLTAAGVASGQFLETFEGIADGTNVNNNGSLFLGGLRITGAVSSAVVTSNTALLGTSSPIDTQALALTEGNGMRGRLDFDAGGATYIGGYDIDQSSLDIQVFYSDLTSETFALETTGSTGASAEFWGIVADSGKLIDAVEFRTVAGAQGWGLDNLEYNSVPEPGTLAALAVGAAFLRKRRQR